MNQELMDMAEQATIRTSHQYQTWGDRTATHTKEDFDKEKFAALVAAAEREACARKVEEFARKWWSIHCDSNKHAETTRRAHDDFCALQAAIRARGKTE